MKIVFHGRNAASFEPGFAAMVGGGHEIVTVADLPSSADDVAAFRSAEVLIGTALGRQHPRPEKVRLYHAVAAGVDPIDRSCLPDGVPLCRCFGHEHSIAEYVMAALLARQVPLAEADRQLRQGQWAMWPGAGASIRGELGDRTIGLLGYGHIGKEVATRARAFGMQVTVANRTPPPVGAGIEESFGLDRLPGFMASADDIVVSLPLTPGTQGIVDAAAIAGMRPGGVIINVGRGPVIEEKALFDALQQRRIAGAVIDTWYVYPGTGATMAYPGNLPFHTLNNCVMTPHMSAWTSGTIRRRQQTVADNIRRFEAGAPLVNSV